MKCIGSVDAHPATLTSHAESHSLREYNGTPEPLNVALAPFTPPRSQHGHGYDYGDPEQYEMTYGHGYYDQQTYLADGYRTPPLPIGESGISTRSGRTLGTPMTDSSSSPASTKSSSPRARRNKKKQQNTSFILNNPLSAETKDYDVPVRDMLAWANRSEFERHHEVNTQHKGNIPRPLNSFMLYRQAYKERIKKWGEQGNNNQLISRVAGVSWNLESQSVKDFYAKVAIAERDNHAAAFPEYKFAPNKTAKKRGRKNDDDDSDSEWEGNQAHGGKRWRRRHETASTTSRSPTPAQQMYPSPLVYSTPLQVNNNHLVTSAPQYSRWIQYPLQYSQYYGHNQMPYQNTIPESHYIAGAMSDSAYVPTSMTMSQDEDYMNLVGMPPTTDVTAGPLPSQPEGYAIDPGLDELNMTAGYQQYVGYPEIGAHDGYELGYELGAEHISHPGSQTLIPDEPVWRANTSAGSAFDDELTRWHGRP